jgi:hypothetical protein
MRRSLLIAAAALAVAGLAQAAQVLTVGAPGQAGIYGSGECPDNPGMTGSMKTSVNPPVLWQFSAQPSSIPTVGSTGLANGTGGTGAYWQGGKNGGFYVDFGSDYSSVSITDTYELWRYYAQPGSPGGFTYWWAPTSSCVFDAGTCTVAPEFGFQDSTYTVNKSTDWWVHEYSGPAVTPAARYLIIDNPAGTTVMGNGAAQWVFVGAVPEPTSLVVLGLGAAGLLVRRRKD